MTRHTAGDVLPLPAPFLSSIMQIEPQWIDYNGHLNMAYYNVLFDRAVDEVFELLGCGADYLKKGFSTFTAEVHVRYLRELHAGDPVRVTFQLLDYDAKRMHYFEQLFHAEEGWVSATSENMSLHVDMAAKKTAPFPTEQEAKAFARAKLADGSNVNAGTFNPHSPKRIITSAQMSDWLDEPDA